MQGCAGTGEVDREAGRRSRVEARDARAGDHQLSRSFKTGAIHENAGDERGPPHSGVGQPVEKQAQPVVSSRLREVDKQTSNS